VRDHPEIKKSIPCGDAEIEYSERGKGEALLLVHGGVFADWFLPMAGSHTLDDFRVIRVCRAGYGPKAPKRALTPQDHASHLAILAKALHLKKLHLVGHSFSGLIGLRLSSDHPELVHSLILMEPAPCRPLQAPAFFAELGERFVVPAMEMFAAGNLDGAFDSFMRGVCGDSYRKVMEQSLGREGYEQAVRQSSFFFRDEVPAAMQWRFGAHEAARIRQPVLIMEGGEGRKYGLLSRQVTELTLALLPQAEVISKELQEKQPERDEPVDQRIGRHPGVAVPRKWSLLENAHARSVELSPADALRETSAGSTTTTCEESGIRCNNSLTWYPRPNPSTTYKVRSRNGTSLTRNEASSRGSYRLWR
jgi:pimeloyl-ACP methyl ester carboxylesterase